MYPECESRFSKPGSLALRQLNDPLPYWLPPAIGKVTGSTADLRIDRISTTRIHTRGLSDA